ncbi:MAG: DNA polymerase Y family protein [Actinomycetota bacterium]|nr:DNA polymerase Y family protein [Actinomycetota bacterium]
MRTAVVWCSEWPVVSVGAAPDEPVAVVVANRVVSVTPAARREGVAYGLRRREAQARCPGLEVVERDEAAEARRFEPVVAAVEAFTPLVELSRPGVCAFATRGPSRYFGGDERLAGLVADAVAEVLGTAGRCRVGVADGPFAAALAARDRRARPTLVIPGGGSPEYLAPLPVAALERPELTGVLVRLGLTTLGGFAALDAADVVARFGAEGRDAHRLASGLDECPPDARRPRPDLAVVAELDPPLERVETAAFVARRLADELGETLSSRGLACVRVVIEAETEHGETRSRLWRQEGTVTAGALADRVRWQLDGWLTGSPAARPSGGLTRLALVPDEVVPAKGRQLGFWGGETEAAERAARALARVEALVGPEAVRVPERRGGRAPAEAYRLVPVGAVDLTTRRPSGGDAADPAVGAPWPGRVPPPSPAVVPADPPPVEVLDASGAVVGVSGRGELTAPPARLVLPGAAPAEIARWAGPWPADERWWDPTRHRRRARLQLVTTGGEAYLVTIEGGQWHLEGRYD